MDDQSILDRSDSLERNLAAVAAITDCAKVLAALQRTPLLEHPPGTMQTGEGFAGGYQLRDDSLPELLAHALVLLDTINADLTVFTDHQLRKKAVPHV